ncbi:hypothetical protein BGW36DRAFT_357296 [Talaromyces proteolyticus]|uniref:Uncharacterized protein n=1 Tax=Talaromyces proteolyticus TaxID=1131652 RepID=A0AAD4Q2R9_9EURO|nr:uncharacterized protein BGW36DRAFT_357296 [Talaromyces proteolyticus]KAH8700643.1 hypothetical protein BGW36DRAFT_357296 [Talaromyces proteolyticus]
MFLLEALNEIMYNLQFGNHQGKVEKYLNEVTVDSLLNDLGQVLKSKLSEIRGLWSIFEAHCFTDDEERFWTKASLKHHIECIHPGVIITELTINLLWRCFQFHAYHPFPRHDVHQIHESAFQRAVILLAVRGTDLLGTQDGGDYIWREDTDFFHDADFRRILRSISHASVQNESDPAMSVVNDVMDVLATTQPHMVNFAPSPDLLEPAARRLLDSVPVRDELRADDLSILLALLLQLRVHKQKWGTSLHFGEFDQGSSCEELARTITTGIFVRGSLSSDTYCNVIDVLPSLRTQFYQLWAVLFQPAKSREESQSNASLAADVIPNEILQTISLFTPQQSVFSHSPISKDEGIVFNISTQQLAVSDDVTINHLLKSLLDDTKHSHVALFANNTSSNVFGAYFPPLSQASKIGRGHFLFQLAPQFCLLQWTSHSIPLTDLINVRDSNSTLLDTIRAGKMLPSTPYRIGNPGEKGNSGEGNSASLWINPDTRSIQLTGQFPNSTRYKVLCERTREDSVDGKEMSTEIDRLYILRVSTFGIDAELAFQNDIETKYRAPSVQADQLIRGAELEARIQGFGSPL